MLGGDAGVLLDDADLFKGQFKGVCLVNVRSCLFVELIVLNCT